MFGRTTPALELIELDALNASRPALARDTLLHELLHAVWYDLPDMLSGDPDSLQENIIRGLTPGLLAALRNNPQLVKFLLEE